ncbi:hypothetical protein [Mycobacterium kyorinense]|nr:hypothetical protein [Mycobacterium kyorinense]
MTSTAEKSGQLVASARGMREQVRAEAAESERRRTLTAAIVDQMWATGLLSAFNPVAAGGVEPSFAEMIETWIEMAWQDGSFGWVGIANLPSTFAAAAVASGAELTPTLRADMRVAAVHATDTARSCAEWAHLAAGTTAIREGSRFERAFRDMYTGTQHAFISEKVAIDAARIWLGIIDDQFGL